MTFFHYALTVALNYKQIKSHPERISKINPFIDQYNWKEISLNRTINQWLSIFCMGLIILKK